MISPYSIYPPYSYSDNEPSNKNRPDALTNTHPSPERRTKLVCCGYRARSAAVRCAGLWLGGCGGVALPFFYSYMGKFMDK